MNYKEAAYSLNMTVKLLKWLTMYSPKNDGRKLLESKPGQFEESELKDFNQYLHGSWDNRNIPKEIVRELKREAHGLCGNCKEHSSNLDGAHIDRKGIEIPHYCQHPHNLILLCPTCHRRYDDIHDKFVTNDLIHTNKEKLIHDLMKDVKFDIDKSELLKDYMDQLKLSTLVTEKSAEEWWNVIAGDLYKRVVLSGILAADPPAAAIPTSGTELKDALSYMSSSIAPTKPITSILLQSISDNVGSVPISYEQEEWENIDQEGQCIICPEQAMLDGVVCAKCGLWDYTVNRSDDYEIEEFNPGLFDVRLPAGDGSYESHPCDSCGSTTFVEISYLLCCSYCDYKMNVDD